MILRKEICLTFNWFCAAPFKTNYNQNINCSEFGNIHLVFMNRGLPGHPSEQGEITRLGAHPI